MSIKRTVVRNATWNWAGMAANMAAGFVTAPFLVRRLGETNYGLWIVIASFTSYFGMLDLGVRGAVGRQIAFRRAQGDRRGVGAVLSTSLAILGVAGVVALLLTVGATAVFTRLFEVPADQVGSARVALLLVGLNLALWLPLNVFDATLWAWQRFDVLNVIDITAVALRTAATFALIGDGHGIVTLAWLNLLALAVAQAVKAAVSFRVDPGLRVGPGLIESAAARELFGYGVWYSMLNVARTLTSQASPLIIGARLGVSFVTPYTVATRLVGYAGALIAAGAGVLTPITTGIHAEGDHARQRWLLLEGGKYCLALSLFFVTTFLLLGTPLIVSWMGPELAPSARLLAVLAVGEVLPMSQWVTYGVILGMGRHRALALANFSECGLAATAAFLVAGTYGLPGVCVAFAVPAAVVRGSFQLVYGCRLVGVSPRRYLAEVVAPTAGLAAVPAAALAVAVAWRPPGSTPELLAYVAVYGVLHVSACALVLVGQVRLRLFGAMIARRFGGVENS